MDMDKIYYIDDNNGGVIYDISNLDINDGVRGFIESNFTKISLGEIEENINDLIDEYIDYNDENNSNESYEESIEYSELENLKYLIDAAVIINFKDNVYNKYSAEAEIYGFVS